MTRPRIMIVEDEPVSALDLHRRLEKMEYEVCASVTSGEAALEKALLLKPDLVLMDIFLDGEMDGIQAATLIHTREHTPVIFLTGRMDPESLERAKGAEPYGYLVKPINTSDLHSTIEMALYKAHAEGERQELIRQLKEALAQVKQLSGFLPICSKCKKIRNDEGYWQQVEHYIAKHSGAVFTHSICRECEVELYPELQEPDEPST